MGSSGWTSTPPSAKPLAAPPSTSDSMRMQDAHVRLRMTLTAPDQNTLRLAIDFRLQFGTEVVTVRGTENVDLVTLSTSGTVTVLVDGGIYATITETDGSLSFVGGGGQDLTADDYTALNAIFEAIGATLTRFDALFAPA